MKTITITKLGVASMAIAMCSTASAAIINISDHSFTPDGASTVSVNLTDQTALGGTPLLPNNEGETIYLVTTFTFGTDTLADLEIQFNADITDTKPRLGIRIGNNGTAQPIGGGSGINTSNIDLAAGTTTMAGQTVVLLTKFYNHSDNESLGTLNLSTLMNTWVNPTGSSMEGSGTSAGDFFNLRNSTGYKSLAQRVRNNSTPVPGTAGASSITNTTILTGADATFANALAIATIPEPSSTALIGLGGLALILRRRR